MFMQVIRARTTDADAVKSEMDRWVRELGPTADGWLGTTAGVTPDGRFVAAVRFESEEAARRNSDRPEQGEWWNDLAQHLEGEATFFESSDVSTSLGGGSDQAGFVQIMEGRVNDVQAAKELGERMEAEMPKRRPDLMGALDANREDGSFISVLYFTSLEEARQGEKEMNENPPPEMAQWDALMDGEMTFYDLEEPWLVSK
ncbi:MAG: hypothetical protein M3N53_08725 [Actinomycetota bacterium]|nr:hypothetical protein [Actinomycetota bacterium]